MENHKNIVSFILCANNVKKCERCKEYIKELTVPENVEIEIIEVWEANSMASGYNEGMQKASGKFKVYLHQDVYIVNANFIQNMLDIFAKDALIGMIGIIGGNDLPEDGKMYQAWNVGLVKANDTNCAGYRIGNQPDKGTVMEVEAIDGLLMMTQYDVAWREDIFFDFDFYDISQSIEFKKKGYKVVIPHMEKEWCIHDCGHTNIKFYDKNRLIFLKEYEEFYQGYAQFKSDDEVEPRYLLFQKMEEMVDRCLLLNDTNLLWQVLEQYNDMTIQSTKLSIIKKSMLISNEEKNWQGYESFYQKGMNWEQISDKYDEYKDFIRGIEYNNIHKMNKLHKKIEQFQITPTALAKIALYSCTEIREVFLFFLSAFKSQNRVAETNFISQILEQIKE